jgi:hypothetical protein
MVWPLPKVHLRWREPKAVHQARTLVKMRGARRWVLSLAATTLSGLLMAAWGLTKLLGPAQPANGPPATFSEMAATTAILTVFVVYIAPWSRLWNAPFVWIMDRKIRWTQGEHRDWPYEQIATCRICTRADGGKPVTILELELTSGNMELLGVPEKVSVELLSRVLKGRGLKVEIPAFHEVG